VLFYNSKFLFWLSLVQCSLALLRLIYYSTLNYFDFLILGNPGRSFQLKRGISLAWHVTDNHTLIGTEVTWKS
jgi:hypothetical protein